MEHYLGGCYRGDKGGYQEIRIWLIWSGVFVFVSVFCYHALNHIGDNLEVLAGFRDITFDDFTSVVQLYALNLYGTDCQCSYSWTLNLHPQILGMTWDGAEG